VVEVPSVLFQPNGWESGELERAGRRRLALCGEALSMARSTVLAALEQVERSKRELHQLLPDRPPHLGEA
jgi:hypothetical protein